MTVEQLKKDFVRQAIKNAQDNHTEDDVLEGIKQAIDDNEIPYELQEDIANTTAIDISDVCSSTNVDNYYRQADYYSKKLGYNIVLDTDWYMGESVDEFFDNLLELVNKKVAIEEKLK